jgi:hypothetical protein
MGNLTDEHGGSETTLGLGEEPLPLLFIFFVLLIGAICKQSFARFPLPYTCVLLLFGALVGIVVR